MRKLFFLPQYHHGKASNPYCDNFLEVIKGDFYVIPKSKHILPRGLELFLGSFKADIYILNWVESIGFLKGGFIQASLSIVSLLVISLRKRKIIWIFHNIHPHEGENFWSKVIKRLMFRLSDIIISHSGEAAKYAVQFARCPVYYKPHPVKIKDFGKWDGPVKDSVFYLWGDIYPYKGIVEFLKEARLQNVRSQILVVGKVVNEPIKNQIESNLSDNIIFENRRADFCEIAAQCKKSLYVVFPYIGDSVSSSGVLMDTLLMGGTPIGPNKGAFSDLAKQGCCITYNNLEEVFCFPTDDEHSLKLNPQNVYKFVNDNTWEAFGCWFINLMGSI